MSSSYWPMTSNAEDWKPKLFLWLWVNNSFSTKFSSTLIQQIHLKLTGWLRHYSSGKGRAVLALLSAGPPQHHYYYPLTCPLETTKGQRRWQPAMKMLRVEADWIAGETVWTSNCATSFWKIPAYWWLAVYKCPKCRQQFCPDLTWCKMYDGRLAYSILKSWKNINS